MLESLQNLRSTSEAKHSTTISSDFGGQLQGYLDVFPTNIRRLTLQMERNHRRDQKRTVVKKHI